MNLGCLLDNAQFLIPRPSPTRKDLEKRFQRTAEFALTHGITSLHDAGFDPMSMDFFEM